MCGICGLAYADSDRPVSAATLSRMRDLIAHRGPDGAGDVTHEGVGLAHRRLSIIDVEGGAQPLANEDGSIWVTFNGEIYNHLELRADLLRRGHKFRTRCDTEVLVHLYEEHGDAFPRLLNGIFAFGLHDRRRHRVLLARDHLGVKPLFYGQGVDVLAFGSEIRPVLAGLGIRPEIRTDSLQEYMVFRYICAPRTFVKGVFRLPPAHVAIWEKGTLRLQRFWDPPSNSGPAVSLEQAEEELHDLLAKAVDRQLMSDVPLGVFCSGGVDSGLVTVYAARTVGPGLASFSFGFDEPGWDETPLAADTARRAGAQHRVLRGEPGEFLAWNRRLAALSDEPVSHPNSVALAQLSQFARQHVKVVLTGEGADELFCGYPRYKIARAHAALQKAPRLAVRALAAILRHAPEHRLRKLGALLPLAPAAQHIFNSAFVDGDVVARITGHDLGDALLERRAVLDEIAWAPDATDTLSRYEMKTYLVSALERLDRVSMASGLEARVPLLDIELVEWGTRLPAAVKLAGGRNKAVLKRLGERTLSSKVTAGPKSGFGLPLDAWFRTPQFQDFIAEIGDPSHPATTHFDGRLLRTIRDDHAQHRAEHGELLWLLANVYLWYDGVAA